MDRDELDRQRKEDLAKIFEDLAKERAPILVEGKRDREALVAGGINRARILMHHGKSRLDVQDSLEHADEVILLLDYDSEGTKISDDIKARLQEAGVRINTSYSFRIREAFDGHITCIEDLKRFVGP